MTQGPRVPAHSQSHTHRKLPCCPAASQNTQCPNCGRALLPNHTADVVRAGCEHAPVRSYFAGWASDLEQPNCVQRSPKLQVEGEADDQCEFDLMDASRRPFR